MGLLGHNGAGKTTIMKMLTGFLEPSAGSITVDGRDVQTHGREIQAQIGYLPESPPIYPELSVAEYLGYAASLRGIDPAAAVRSAIGATGLAEKAYDRVSTLSRGYKQRVGVAQAILHRPKFLILDEPSNGLDPSQILEMRALIRDLAETSTVIISTHIMQEVDAVCDRAIILNRGRVAVDARLQALRATSTIEVETRAGVDLAAIAKAVDGVGEVTEGTPGQFQLTASGDLDATIAALATRMVEGGVPIYGLNKQILDLESIFRDVSGADLQGGQSDAA